MDVRATPDGLMIRVRVSAGASRNRITGVHGDALKVAVTQAPERGKANRSVARLLADAFDLRSAEVVLGHTSRDKWVLLRGIDEETLRSLLVRFGLA